MIWEQTIKLTRPLRSVRLEVSNELNEAISPQQSSEPEAASAGTLPEDTIHPGVPRDRQSNTDQLLQTLIELLRTRQELGKETTRELQVIAIEIAMAVTERLFLTQTPNGELELQRLVSEALSVLAPTGPVTVHLHPEDIAGLQSATSAISASELELVADASLDRGNCQIDADAFGVRFDWAEQLSEVRQRMLQGLMDAHGNQ